MAHCKKSLRASVIAKPQRSKHVLGLVEHALRLALFLSLALLLMP